MKKYIKPIAIVAVLIWFLFQFVLTYHRQDNNTMSNTIQQDELLWINKLAVGGWFLGMKLPGLSSIKHNDIVYFAFPQEYDNPVYDKTRMVSRIIGLPGDNIEIKHKDLIVNNQQIPLPDSAKITYRVVLKKDSMSQSFIDRHNISGHKKLVKDMGVYEIPLTEHQLKKIKSDQDVDYARLLKTYSRKTREIFPDSKFITWSRDIFGPVKVPAKGENISIELRNYGIYREIIEFYEGNNLRIHKGDIFINGIRSNSYTIKKNYYFVLDDNRDHMNDSRRFGFIPEEYILGKVIGKE